jgi:diacylglycerol kinase (ATP)
LLQSVLGARPTPFDRWILRFANENGRQSTLNNYFSLGLDAKIAMNFHRKREAKPSMFRSRTMNKLVYGVYGTRELFTSSSSQSIINAVEVEADGVPLKLPRKSVGIIVLNIPSYASGTHIWHHSKQRSKDKTKVSTLEMKGGRIGKKKKKKEERRKKNEVE